MKTQDYANHKKFHPLFHFFLVPVLGILLILGIVKIFTDSPNRLVWTLFTVLIFLMALINIMIRQDYGLKLQNRIIRLEFRQRYFELYAKRSETVEEQLSFGQIAALRFAYDDEFKLLLEKTLQQNLSPKAIKTSITKWKGDYRRV